MYLLDQSDIAIKKTIIEEVEYILTETTYLMIADVIDACQDARTASFEELATFEHRDGTITQLSLQSFDDLAEYGIAAGYGPYENDPFTIEISTIEDSLYDGQLNFSVRSYLVQDT